MKNFIKSFLLVLISLLCSATAKAYVIEVDGIYYNVNVSDFTCEVTNNGVNSYSGDVCIPASITYKSKNLVVTSIGYEAFRGCTNLTSIVIGDSVAHIHQSAFVGCSSLTSITIPSSVTRIDDYVFEGCSSVRQLIIEDGDETLSLGQCEYSSTYDGWTTSYYTGLFYNCPIETVYLGRDLNCDFAPFYNGLNREGNAHIKKVTIGNWVSTINHSTFYKCSGLTSVIMGENVKNIGRDAFDCCWGITNIYMQGANPPYVASDNFSDKHFVEAILYVPNGSLAAYQSADTWKKFWDIKEYDATGIDDIGADNIETKFTGNGICVPDAVGEAVYVYNVNGAVAGKFSHYDGGEIPLDKGTYIIRIGERSIKVQL